MTFGKYWKMMKKEFVIKRFIFILWDMQNR